MRTLEKITWKQFEKDTKLSKEEYESYSIPKRSTKHAAGYDFEVLEDFKINPQETKLIPTGIKANMNEDEVLLLIVRSSTGIKYNIRLNNQVGVIDKDYYNNPDNEGHIFIKITNEGQEAKTFKKKDKIIQGIFTKFLIIDNEENIKKTREGGIGSTTSKESEKNE